MPETTLVPSRLVTKDSSYSKLQTQAAVSNRTRFQKTLVPLTRDRLSSNPLVKDSFEEYTHEQGLQSIQFPSFIATAVSSITRMSKFAWNLLSTNVIFNCTLALLGMLLAYSSSSQIRLPPRFAFICCTILSLVYALFTDEIPPLCEDPSRSSYVDNTCAFASPSGNVDLSTARWPDYGLSPEGTIILDLTSPTVLGEFAQDPYFFPTPPIAVIEEDVRIARCWKFAGSQGHVTIKLAKPIHLSNLTIYYPDYHELPSWRLKEVPKLIRVWASIPSVFDTPYTPHAPSPHSLATWEVFMGTKKSGKPVALGDVESFAHGGTFSYDVLQGTRQTFALHIPSHFWTSVVVIEVLDNLGGSTTCLHRIAVHGEEFEI